MRKIIRTLMSFTILCCMVPLSHAIAATKALPLTCQKNFSPPMSMAVVEDTIWLLSNGGLHRILFREGAYETSDSPLNFTDNSYRLASYQDHLYALSYRQQELLLYRLDMKYTQEWMPVGESLDIQGFFTSNEDAESYWIAGFAFLNDDAWVALLSDFSANSLLLWGNSVTGEIHRAPIDQVQSIAATGNSQLYATLSNGTFASVDPQTGKLQELAHMDGPAFCLAATEDESLFYMADSDSVYTFTFSAGLKECDRSPLSFNQPGLPGCVIGEQYLFGDYYGLYVSTPEASGSQALTISGFENEAVMQAFEAEHDIQIDILGSSPYYDAHKLMQDMVNRTGDCDIYILPVSAGYLPLLLEKGYYVPLEESETLASAFENYDGNRLPLLKDDLHYAAFPQCAIANVLCINEATMEALGISVASLPSTLFHGWRNRPSLPLRRALPW